jgi:hypothetical protein
MANGQVVEEVADGLEKVAVGIEDVAVKTRGLTGEKIGYIFTGFGMGVIVGFGVGYFVAEQRLKTKYSKLASEEINKVREHYYAKTVAAEPKPSINEVIEKTDIPPRPTKPPVVVEEAKPVVVNNVFDESTDREWSYAEELTRREPGVPYIIHIDEFRVNEPEHTQVSYTYYEQDDVLCDSHFMKVDDMDEAIGLGNLGHWGHGSNDPNVVYVRNEKLNLDFEVVRDRGLYAEAAHGYIRHSAERSRKHPRRGFDDD